MERGLPHSSLWDMARAVLLLFGKLEVKGNSANSLLAILEELIGMLIIFHDRKKDSVTDRPM